MADGGDEWFGLENASRRKKESEQLYEEAKKIVNEEQNYSLGLRKLKEADKLFPLQKYKKRIDELIEFMKEEDISLIDSVTESTENFVTLQTGLKIRKQLHEKLYGYQLEGVEWLHRKFLQSDGCILADDMGLGKTIQTISLISSLFDSKAIHHVLIVAPTTLLLNWGKEFSTWAPDIKVFKFDGSLAILSRLRALQYVQEEGGVLLSTYDLCRNFSQEISSCRGRYFVWDYLILDEGHKIKNATKTTKSIHDIPSRNRLILTGTPVQNNLKELWALYDFVMKGTLLGTYRTFKEKFELPILRGREKDARNRQIIQSQKTAESLRQIYSPYFLRRTKNQVFKGKNSAVKLPRKIDLVVWIYLSETQISVYRDFLNSDDVKNLILQANMRSALTSLIVLKKICDHPRLLSRRVCNEVLNNPNLSFDDDNDDKVSIDNVSDQQLIMESAKLSFCLFLLEKLKEEGHKTLLFSQSTKMLDIIQRILLERNWKMSRLDGKVVNMRKRDGIVRAFESDQSIPLCLLSSQVGGVGLTLISANRVIIYDPSWNPATDSQAIDRAYRIGQKREVVVYRLVTCGTVEEKIYKRQIFKDSITKQTVGAEKDPTRYFTGADLRQLFEFSDPKVSKTLDLINEIHGKDINYNRSINSHLESLKNSSDVLDMHDHNILFSNEEPEVVEEIEVIDLINEEVKMARENLNKESLSTKQILVESGAYARPFQLHVSDKRILKKPEQYAHLNNPSEVIEIRDSLPGNAEYYTFVEDFSDVHIIDGPIDNGESFNENEGFRKNFPMVRGENECYQENTNIENAQIIDEYPANPSIEDNWSKISESSSVDDSLCRNSRFFNNKNPTVLNSDTENCEDVRSIKECINNVDQRVKNEVSFVREESFSELVELNTDLRSISASESSLSSEDSLSLAPNFLKVIKEDGGLNCDSDEESGLVNQFSSEIIKVKKEDKTEEEEQRQSFVNDQACENQRFINNYNNGGLHVNCKTSGDSSDGSAKAEPQLFIESIENEGLYATNESFNKLLPVKTEQNHTKSDNSCDMPDIYSEINPNIEVYKASQKNYSVQNSLSNLNVPEVERNDMDEQSLAVHCLNEILNEIDTKNLMNSDKQQQFDDTLNQGYIEKTSVVSHPLLNDHKLSDEESKSYIDFESLNVEDEQFLNCFSNISSVNNAEINGIDKEDENFVKECIDVILNEVETKENIDAINDTLDNVLSIVDEFENSTGKHAMTEDLNNPSHSSLMSRRSQNNQSLCDATDICKSEKNEMIDFECLELIDCAKKSISPKNNTNEQSLVEDCVNIILNEVETCERISVVNETLDDVLENIMKFEKNDVQFHNEMDKDSPNKINQKNEKELEFSINSFTEFSNLTENELSDIDSLCQTPEFLKKTKTNVQKYDQVDKITKETSVLECINVILNGVETEERGTTVNETLNRVLNSVEKEERSMTVNETLSFVLNSVENEIAETPNDKACCLDDPRGLNIIAKNTEKMYRVQEENCTSVTNCVNDILENVEDDERSSIVEDLLSDVLIDISKIEEEESLKVKNCVSSLLEEIDASVKSKYLDHLSFSLAAVTGEFSNHDSEYYSVEKPSEIGIGYFQSYEKIKGAKESSSRDSSITPRKRRASIAFKEQLFDTSETQSDENAFSTPLASYYQSTPNKILRIPTTVPSSVTLRKPLKRRNNFELSDSFEF